MIADPLVSRIQNLVGQTLQDSIAASYDMVSPGPGSASTRKLSAASSASIEPAMSLTSVALIKHEVTKAGRRRSTFRIDALIPVGGFDSPDNGTPHSASAYIVVDQQDVGSPADTLVADMVVTALLNALVSSRASSSVDFVASSYLTDFLNGEP